jgi:hypothetical protein
VDRGFREFGYKTGSSELCEAVAEVLQQAIVQTDLGYDADAMRQWIAVWQAQVLPEVLVVCVRRMELFEAEQNQEMLEVDSSLLESLRQKPQMFARLVALVVEDQ